MPQLTVEAFNAHLICALHMRTCGKHWFHFSASVQVGFILSWTGRLLPGCDCDMCYSTLYLGRVVPDTRLTKIELTMHAQ